MSENPGAALSFEQAADALMEPEQATPTSDDAHAEEVEVEAETEEVEVEAEAEATDEADEDADAGDEPEEAEEEVEAEDEDPVYTLKINGKEEERPLSEILRGYSRNEDYTRKTMELANERRDFHTERDSEREAIRNQKTQLEDALTHFAIPTQQEPNWAVLAQQMDPQQYNLARVQWEEQTRQQERAREALAQFKDQERQELLGQEREKLLTHFPEWSDATAWNTAAAEMVEHGKHYGFDATDLDGLADHRMFRVLQDAIAYRKGQAAANAAVKKVAKAPKKLPTGKPTGKNQRANRKRQEAMSRHKKVGTIDSAIDALMS